MPAERSKLQISRRRKVLFAAVTFLMVIGVSFVALLALDIYLHHRVQYLAGVNVWGYRGDVVGKKKPGEVRIVALGGSTAWGYGLPWNEAWPYYLDQKLNARLGGKPLISVVNLGVPADTASTFVTTLKDYQYLDVDVACFYEGYNDLGQGDGSVKGLTNPDVANYMEWRYQSPIFRWTGYFPIFPLVLNEKAMALLYGGNLKAAYGSEKIVFRPNLATRTTAAALKTASDLGVAVEKRFGQISNVRKELSETTDDSCGRWSQYCGAVYDAVRHTVSLGKQAVVITQPYLSDLHIEQQAAMASMLAKRFGTDPRVRYVNLGRALDIRDASLVYDGIHLVARGNEIIADRLVPELVAMVR